MAQILDFPHRLINQTSTFQIRVNECRASLDNLYNSKSNSAKSIDDLRVISILYGQASSILTDIEFSLLSEDKVEISTNRLIKAVEQIKSY